MDLGIRGKIALITGADSGIGFETAKMLLQEGVRVVISDIRQDNVDKAVEALRPFGEVQGFAADLKDADAAQTLYASARDAMGEPDILVNSAGITGAQGDFLETDDKGWFDALDTNLMSAVRVARAAIPAMRQKKWGRVILIGSEDAEQPYVEELPYCASKAAILNLAKGLSKAYGPDNVLVNTVSPAFIATPMTDKMMTKRAEQRGESFDETIGTFLDEQRPGMALKRRGKAEEVAAMIVFLCSERASFVNGSNHRVDSGSVVTV